MMEKTDEGLQGEAGSRRGLLLEDASDMMEKTDEGLQGVVGY
jgi:hypothetical protein